MTMMSPEEAIEAVVAYANAETERANEAEDKLRRITAAVIAAEHLFNISHKVETALWDYPRMAK